MNVFSRRIQILELLHAAKRVYDKNDPLLSHLLAISNAQFTFKAPLYLNELIVHYSPLRSFMLADSFLLPPQKAMLKQRGDRAFSVVVKKLWNKVPVDVRMAPSLSVFINFILKSIFTVWLLRLFDLSCCVCISFCFACFYIYIFSFYILLCTALWFQPHVVLMVLYK